MRKVLVSLMMLSLVPAIAMAGLTNPDGFEVYTPTIDWQPNQTDHGWTVSVSAAQLGSAYSGYGLPGQGLTFSAPLGEAHWYAALDTATIPLQTFTVDFQKTGETGIQRLLLDAGSDGYGGANQGAFHLEFYSGPAFFEHWSVSGNKYVKTYFSGASTGWTDGEWHTATVEMDFNNHTVRGRVDDVGGAAYAYTNWIAMPDQDHPNISGPAYSYTEIRTVFSAGSFNTDNYSLTGEGPSYFPGDANNDGVVSADDYGSVQLNFGDIGEIGILGDANLDGVVSADDYGSVQLNFGNTQGVGGIPVPEPATLMLLGAAGAMMLRLRRRS